MGKVSLWKRILLMVCIAISVGILVYCLYSKDKLDYIDLIASAVPFLFGFLIYILEWIKRGFNISYQDGKIKITETSFQNTIDETNTTNGESKTK